MYTHEQRKEKAKEIREAAAQLSYNRNTIVGHANNGDEALPSKLMSFTKGLPHNQETGLLLDDADFTAFVQGIDSGDPADFQATRLGGKVIDFISDKAKTNKAQVRAWESAGAGLTFDLQGPDAQAVTMKPAPKLGSDELTAEMAEVYAQALLRDIPFSVFYSKANSRKKDRDRAKALLQMLNKLPWFQDAKRTGLSGPLTLDTAFRGFTEGDLLGPYISQFLLAGNTGLDNRNDETKEFDASDGQINFGAISISQKVRKAKENLNFMTSWEEWFDVQQGANVGRLEEYKGNARRFITTGRDLSTYVHYDALYQAYLNACLLLIDPNVGARFDEGVPFQGSDSDDHQQGFAHFGGPHILSLVTEVATRALKAVRFQKFNVHRRLRPEAFAARFEKFQEILPLLAGSSAQENLQKTYQDLEATGIFHELKSENGHNLLLPMAFCEGSPMHPSYGAGHATVAAACVTILKAFFDHTQYLYISEDGEEFKITDDKEKCKYAFVPGNNGRKLRTVETEALNLEGELNKLAANISIGRDWAGVHYYSDYEESMRMGEEIALGLLVEQSITYNPKEEFFLTLPKFDGSLVFIAQGEVTSSRPTF